MAYHTNPLVGIAVLLDLSQSGFMGPKGLFASVVLLKEYLESFVGKDYGHFSKECTAVLCDNCEGNEHETDACPLLSAPKPQVVMHGIITEGLVFYESVSTMTYRPKIDSTRLARLSVTGGALSVPQVVTQLQRVVPSDDFVWDVTQVGHNVFKVPFPSKVELERLKVFGSFRVPNSKCEIKVDAWAAKMEPIHMLPQKWIRISGIPPKERGDFLQMWGLGSLFGKTLKVDMKFTRKHGVLRILVGCVDYTLIPNAWTLFMKDGFYRLRFVVENPVDVGDSADYTPPDPPNDHDKEDKDPKDESDAPGDDGSAAKEDGQEKMITDDAPSSNDTTKPAEGSKSDMMQEKLSGVVFSPQVKKQIMMARRVLFDLNAGINTKNINEAHNPQAQVVHEGNGQHTAAEENQVFAAPAEVAAEKNEVVAAPVEVTAVNNTVFPDPAQKAAVSKTGSVSSPIVDTAFGDNQGHFVGERDLSPLRGVPSPSCSLSPKSPSYGGQKLTTFLACGEGNADMDVPKYPARSNGPLGAGNFLTHASPTEEEILAFGGMKEVSRTEARSSDRLRAKPNADLPQLERAMELAQNKDAMLEKGTPIKSKLSILSFSDTEIKNRADRLGISLGKSKQQVLDSISVIRDVEHARSVVFLENNLRTDEEQSESSFVLRRAANLSEDLVDDEVEPLINHADLLERGIKVTRGRKKKIDFSNRVIRRSARIKKLNKSSK